jgi:diacylglycerol kinase (ATP)
MGVNTDWTILLNPKAGALRGARAGAAQIEEMARGVGLAARVVPVSSAREMRPTVRRLAADGAKIAVAGGDGTVALAAQEMAHTDAVLGILPQGTFNNFATALRLPMSLPAALRALKDGAVREVSLGRVGDTYFTESAGVGLFADALEFYGQGPKKNPVRSAYALARVLTPMRAPRLRLTLDGGETRELRSVFCAVANTHRMGLGLSVAPDAKLTDEVFDVLVVGELTRAELLPYFRAMRAQTHLGLPKVTVLRAREVRIETPRHALPLHCDDHVAGATPATVTLHPRALKVVVDSL